MSILEPSPDSPFSPPRAGHASGFWRAWHVFRRRARLGDLRVPPAVARLQKVEIPWPFFGVVLVPTLGICLLPNPLWRRAGLALFWLALFVAVAEYARTAGSLAFGLAAAAHGIGAAAHREIHAPPVGDLSRLFRRLATTCSAALVFSLVAPHLASRLVIAVVGKNGPILINPASSVNPPRVGELVAYRLGTGTDSGIRIERGVYFGRVLATGPDQTISFTEGGYRVDRGRFALLPHMPRTGSFSLDATHAFVWPEIFNFRNGPRDFSGNIGVIEHSALVGRPYKRWFWHTQSP